MINEDEMLYMEFLKQKQKFVKLAQTILKHFFSYFLGRVINNVFVPANAVVPESVNVRQPKGQ